MSKAGRPICRLIFSHNGLGSGAKGVEYSAECGHKKQCSDQNERKYKPRILFHWFSLPSLTLSTKNSKSGAKSCVLPSLHSPVRRSGWNWVAQMGSDSCS